MRSYDAGLRNEIADAIREGLAAWRGGGDEQFHALVADAVMTRIFARDDDAPPVRTGHEAARLSRLLFYAREEISMWADVVESRSGQPADAQRRVIREIDGYRAERGWSPHGFGGEEYRPC